MRNRPKRGCNRYRQMRFALPFRIFWKGHEMRAVLCFSLGLIPASAFAHTGHAAGTGHELWGIGLAFAIAAIFGLTRKA